MLNKLKNKLKCVPNKHLVGYALIISGVIMLISFLPGRALGVLSGIAIAVIGYCLIQS